jgi:hypothetical protein
MFLWPRITPGSVSTSISVIEARCASAKRRIWSCAKRMSSMSRAETFCIAASISEGVRRKLSGV